MSSLCLPVLNSFSWELFELYYNIWCWTFSFSVHQCQIKSQRQSSGWNRKDSFIALPGKGRHSGMCHALKTMCPNMGKFYSNSSKRAWSVHGHSSNGWMVRWVEVIIKLQSNWSGVYILVVSVSSLIINFPTWRGFQYLWNSSKTLLCVTVDGEAQGFSWLFVSPGLTSSSFPN